MAGSTATGTSQMVPTAPAAWRLALVALPLAGKAAKATPLRLRVGESGSEASCQCLLAVVAPPLPPLALVLQLLMERYQDPA